MKKFVHDCDNCIFLGTYKEKHTRNEIWGRKLRKYEIYFCMHEKSFIFRYGNGSNYFSFTFEEVKNYQDIFRLRTKRSFEFAWKKYKKIIKEK